MFIDPSNYDKLRVEILYGFIAVIGGIARYLNSYVSGTPFNFSIFIASSLVAGFSGNMFALLGQSLQMPQTTLFIMAGVGGFFGDQTMKLLLEYISSKAQKS